MEFPIQIATIKMGIRDCPLCILKGSQTFPNKYVLQSLNIVFIIANSADPDEMQH